MKAQKAYPLSAAFLFLLSLAYLGAELLFNTQLLDVSASVRSDQLGVERVQNFGRLVSSLGFSLLVLGFFQRFGFRLTGWLPWAAFLGIAFACIAPFVIMLWQIMSGAASGSGAFDYGTFAWYLLPLIGMQLVIIGRGRIPFFVILTLVVLTGPAMYYGQKLVIERFVVEKTTAEDRLNANYILLLRKGIEDCAISLDTVSFCDDAAADDVEKRATRAILGALFMLNPAAVFKSLEPEQNRIIDGISVHGLWFSPRDYYQRYLAHINAERRLYERFLNERYYLPYQKASGLYMEATIPEKLEKIAVTALSRTEEGIERGWQKYREAVAEYRRVGFELGMRAARAGDTYTQHCREGSDCERILREKHKEYCNNKDCVTEDDVIQHARKIAEKKFQEQTGYPPDLADKAAFLKHPKTRKIVRADIEKNIQDAAADPDFSLLE